MKNWTQRSLTVPGLFPLGGPVGRGQPSQMALLEQAAPLRSVPGQHGPAHVDVISGNALIPTAIQAMIGFEVPNHRLNVRSQPLQALAPGRVGIPVTPLAFRGNTDTATGAVPKRSWSCPG
jgi:hypothetical protein